MYTQDEWHSFTITRKRQLVLEEQNFRCTCGINKWRGEPIVLEFEHKDGNNQNNSRGNVEFLCPNCHSQTSTWRGRNKGSGLKITDDDFASALVKAGTISAGLTQMGLAPKGGNYKRAHRLVKERCLPVSYPKGSRCSFSKLSDDDVRRGRRLRDEDGWTYERIAKELGVTRSTIAYAIRGLTHTGVI